MKGTKSTAREALSNAHTETPVERERRLAFAACLNADMIFAEFGTDGAISRCISRMNRMAPWPFFGSLLMDSRLRR